MSRAALAAVTRLGRTLDLPVSALDVVSDRGNLLVHLAPAPVLARVATLTAFTRRDPFAWLAREVTVAAHASRRGGPVGAPAPDAGPHHVDGFAISLWEYRDVLPGRANAFDLGVKVGELHRSTHGVDGLPWLVPVTDQISEALDVLEADDALPATMIAALHERHRVVLAGLDGAGSAPVVLHGDAHGGNLRRDRNGWFWIDLEETCAGPPEWDLAVAAGDGDPAGVLAGWTAATGRQSHSLEPFTGARTLEAAVWLAAMAHLRPAVYRDVADRRLAHALGFAH